MAPDEPRKIIYLDLLAKVKAEPRYIHLMELVEKNPSAALEEINDTINAIPLMNDREVTFLLMGYLQGVCAYSIAGTRKSVMTELRERLTLFFNDGMFNYRRILR